LFSFGYSTKQEHPPRGEFFGLCNSIRTKPCKLTKPWA